MMDVKTLRGMLEKCPKDKTEVVVVDEVSDETYPIMSCYYSLVSEEVVIGVQPEEGEME